MAPIDPENLIRALDPLLSKDGGIKSMSETPKVCSLVAKFSKRLVSRTIYLNVLEATEASILQAFLDGGGWKTLNEWLQEACTLKNDPFISQLMGMFNKLPMTLDRLKQNNTPKLIKSLSKNPDESIKNLAQEIVEKWMKIIQIDPHHNKKKKRDSSDEGPIKKIKKFRTNDRSETHNGGGVKRHSFSEDDDDKNFKENNHQQQAQNNSPTKKAPKIERPKTVKTYHSKFRSTGLEQAVPLPNEMVKKSLTADKSSLILKSSFTKRPMAATLSSLEKKLKLDSLINHSAERANQLHSVGIKLIQAKPKPTIQDSNLFMQSLDKASTTALRRKKKLPGPTKPTTPPPMVAVPKLEFYKDTLMDVKTTPTTEVTTKDTIPAHTAVKEEKVSESLSDQEKVIDEKPAEEMEAEEEEEEEEERKPLAPGETRSILVIVKKTSRKKKKIHWKEEQDLVQTRYFDLEENERVNVNKIKGDIKLIEMKQERQKLDFSKRVKGDKMEETIPWQKPKPIDLPLSIIEPGSNSEEKKVQLQRVCLQTLYFSKDSIPDSAQEPEATEILLTTEPPKLIPLEDMTNPTPVSDYSDCNPDLKSPTTPPANLLTGVLPTVLTSLFNRNLLGGVLGLDNSLLPTPVVPNLNILDANSNRPPILLAPSPPMMHQLPFDRAPLPPPPQQQAFKAGFLDTESGGTWLPLDSKPLPMMQQQPPEEFMGIGGGFMNHPPNMPPHQLPFRGNGPLLNNPNNNQDGGGGGKGHGGPRPPWNNQQQRLRMRGPPRVPCKHFAMGTCRFGNKCTFLHPGINGPPL